MVDDSKAANGIETLIGKEAHSLLTGLASQLDKYEALLRSLTQRDVIDTLTYSEVVDYFRSCRPKKAPQGMTGALLRLNTVTYDTVLQIFLDADEKPVSNDKGAVYGRIIKFRDADTELRQVLKGHELVLFR